MFLKFKVFHAQFYESRQIKDFFTRVTTITVGLFVLNPMILGFIKSMKNINSRTIHTNTHKFHQVCFKTRGVALYTSRAKISSTQPVASPPPQTPLSSSLHLKHCIRKKPLNQLKMVTIGMKLTGCTSYILVKMVLQQLKNGNQGNEITNSIVVFRMNTVKL